MAEIPNFTIDDITKMITAIRGDNHNAKKHALSNLHNIAKALGPQRTRDELIPYTIEAADYDEEENAKIAEALGRMLPLIGGENEISILLQPLRYLCENEDPDVRDPAVDAIVSLIKASSESGRSSKLTTLIKGMATDTWYSLRCASASLICRSMTLFSPADQDAFCALLGSLSTDSTVLVRKTLALELPTFVASLEKTTPKTNQKVVDTLFQILTALARDEAPAVTIELPAALSAISSISAVFAKSTQFILDTARLLFSGPWQARAALLNAIPSIFTSATLSNSGNAGNSSEFLRDAAQKGASDQQVEVKVANARLIPFLWRAQVFPKAEFAAFVNSVISDHSDFVREAAAKALGALTPSRDKKEPQPPKDILESSLSKLMTDVAMDVKIAALTAIATTGSVSGATVAKHTADLVKFAVWRTRKSIATALVLVSSKLPVSEFDAGFLGLFVALLGDEAADVRTEALSVAEELVKAYGPQWRDRSVMPALEKMASSGDYLLRETAAAAIVRLGLADKCRNSLESLAKDQVANVRMVVAKELPREHPLLVKLRNDSDADVSSYASLPQK